MNTLKLDPWHRSDEEILDESGNSKALADLR